MSRATSTRDLYSLLPGITGTLPSELIELTTSLLAQSRSKAGSLKPEEEIARSYVCANIACERLKSKLDLPDIIPRPPCPQRAYKKLFQYLNTALASAPRNGPSTPSKWQRGGIASNSVTPNSIRTPTTTKRTREALNRAAEDTPTKGSPPPITHTQSTKTSAKADISHIEVTTPDSSFPPWLMKSIRRLAMEFKQQATIPHIFTGVCITARRLANDASNHGKPASSLAKRRQAPSIGRLSLSSLSPLTFVIMSYVFAQFEEDAPSVKEYMARRDKAYEVFTETIPEEAISNEEGLLLLPKSEWVNRGETYLRQADQEGWLQMEWFANVREAAVNAENQEDVMDVDRAQDKPEQEEDAVLPVRQRRKLNIEDNHYQGGGEMLMFAVDWLSEARIEAGKHWQSSFLARLDALPKA